MMFLYHDLKVYPTQTTPSPEGTGEAAPNDEVNDVKTLTKIICCSFKL